MTKTDKAWIAGFFDGEGCITISYTGEKRWHTLCVQIGNIRPHEIEWIHSYYGGTLLRRKTSKSTNLVTRWRVYSKKAVLFLEDILPYCKSKRRRVLLALAFRRYKVKSRPTSGRTLPEGVHERREQFRRAISRLNHTKYDEQYYKNTHKQAEAPIT